MNTNTTHTIDNFFTTITKNISFNYGALFGFYGPSYSGKTCFSLLLAKNFLKLDKNVLYFSSDIDIKNHLLIDIIKNDKNSDKFIHHRVFNINNIKNIVKGLDKNVVLIIDNLDLLLDKDESGHNKKILFSIVEKYNIFYTINNNNSISTQKILIPNHYNNLLYMSSHISIIKLEKEYDWKFLISVIKDRSSNFYSFGGDYYQTRLKHIFRKIKIRNFIDSL